MTEITTTGSSTQSGLATIHKKKLEEVHCLFIPIKNELILLPNATVAEIISYSKPQPFSEAPPWLLGRIDWRERKIPLVAFEILSGIDAAEVHKDSRIVVLNTLNGNHELPYIAFFSQAIPHLMSINEKMIIDIEDDVNDHRHSILRHVVVNEDPAVIPDIDDIESRLIRLHS